MVNDKQMTVIWHVDSLKVSHVDKMRVHTKFSEWMETLYGKTLTVHGGKNHNYLGMNMNWSKDGKITTSIIKYLHQVLEDFIEEIKKSSVTPSAECLFKIREKIDAAQLSEELAVIFHYTVAQLLFLCQHARQDIQTPFYFPTKDIKNPDKDD